jgi:hypothetical protein
MNDWRDRGYDSRNSAPRPSPYERRTPFFFQQPY